MLRFKLERNGEIINESIKGFYCSNNYPNSIQIAGKYDIAEADWLIDNSNNRRYFIDGIKPIAPTACILHYQSEYEFNNQKDQRQQITIGSINGNAIIGSQQYATINLGASFEEVRNFINTSKEIADTDKVQFQKLVDSIEMITSNNMPISKGTFQNYADLASKYSPVFAAVIQPITSWLIGK
ncbi:hypothetical protein M7775_02355 [Sporomusa sphaeroides DSM 2875]|uniref:hypothetical protein n=1 Tax=Sporomusa sphaeroides TaxID=47679 RepID=UPI00202F0EB0|nr:hypothetical protein [Sporomusa sphaeroides]MCM0757408.1 hypothetical protein [Sporomusa sphaeroides DSM 2875]